MPFTNLINMVLSLFPDRCPSLGCWGIFTLNLTGFHLTVFLKLESCSAYFTTATGFRDRKLLSFIVVYEHWMMISIAPPSCLFFTSHYLTVAVYKKMENEHWAFSELVNEIIFLFPAIRYKILLLKPDSPMECSVLPRVPLKTCLFSLTPAICLHP